MRISTTPSSAFKASTSTVMPLTYDNWVVSAGTISHPVTLLVTPNVLVCDMLTVKVLNSNAWFKYLHKCYTI